MLNCKPGDLAIIIYDNLTENIGAIVEVIKPGNTYGDDESFYWHCKYQGAKGLSVVYYDMATRQPTHIVREYKGKFDIKDAYLRPIRGDLLTISQDVRREVELEAL